MDPVAYPAAVRARAVQGEVLWMVGVAGQRTVERGARHRAVARLPADHPPAGTRSARVVVLIVVVIAAAAAIVRRVLGGPEAVVEEHARVARPPAVADVRRKDVLRVVGRCWAAAGVSDCLLWWWITRY